MRVENKVLLDVYDSDIKDGEFHIPAGTTSIGEDAFYECHDLISIDIPAGVTSIEHMAFADCINLTSIVLPDGLTVIGVSAFLRCKSLTSLVIPASVTAIGNSAFADCNSLSSVVIPGNVTSIGDKAFRGCSNLTSITIPASVVSIGTDAFDECGKLSVIHIEADTQASYEKILDLLPKHLQQKIHDNHKEFIEKSLLLLGGRKQDESFFKQANMPADITRELIADLARQYDIPLFMLNQAYQKFGIKAVPPIDEHKTGMNG